MKKHSRVSRLRLAVIAVFGLLCFISTYAQEKPKSAPNIYPVDDAIFTKSGLEKDKLVDEVLPAGKEKLTAELTRAGLSLAAIVTNDYKEAKTLHSQKEGVVAITYSPDGKTLASEIFDNSITLWDPETGKESKTIPGFTGVQGIPPGSHPTLAFAPAGGSLAAWSGVGFKLWEVGTWKELLSSLGEFYAGAYSPDGKTLALGTWKIFIRDIRSNQVLNTLPGHTKSVNSLVFSPDGHLLASTAMTEQAFHVWDVRAGKILHTFGGHSDAVLFTAFSPDGKMVASASDDKTIKIWDVGLGKELKTLKGHTDSVTSVAFSPDGKTIASSSKDGSVKVWDIGTGRLLQTIRGHEHLVLSVTFSPDGKTLASASIDGNIKLWRREKSTSYRLASKTNKEMDKAGQYLGSHPRLPLFFALSDEGKVQGYLYSAETDFSVGKPSAPPFPESEAGLASDEPITAGATAELKVTVANTKGKGDLFQMAGIINCPEMPSLDKTLVFLGKIAAGASVSKTVSLPTSASERDTELNLRITFYELNDNLPKDVKLSLKIKGVPTPNFALAVKVLDGIDGKGVGNGDGVIEVGEAPECLFTVTNASAATAENLLIKTSAFPKVEGVEFFGLQEQYQLGKLAPGEEKQFAFTIQVKRSFAGKNVKLPFTIQDDKCGLKKETTVTMVIGPAPE